MRIVLFTIALIASLTVQGQELNCQVQVVAPTIQGTQTRIFESLETTIYDFMNNRKWTADKFEIHERIVCNIFINITSINNNTDFQGSIQVNSKRIVYNSDYETNVLNLVDNDIQFTYLENTLLEFSPDIHRSNLASILGYYAYLILGADYDTQSLEGGTPYYAIAQQIVGNAQNAPQPGWKAFENTKNRYWIVENILHNSFKPMRKATYDYHRNGLDLMYQNVNLGRAKIVQSIEQLKKVHQLRPLSYNMQLFFLAKSDELVYIFKEAPQSEVTKLLGTLEQIDPGNISKYNKIN
ncbi:MAG: DUF4835 family protein [Bacteroidota bacterium]